MEKEFRPVCFGHFLLEFVSRHFGLTATINQHRLFRSEPPGLGHRVDRRVSTADHGDALSDRDLVQRPAMNLFDEIESIDDFRQVLAGNTKALSAGKAYAQKNSVIVALQISSRDLPSNLDVISNLDAQGFDHLDLLQAHLRLHFVISDPVRVEAAGSMLFLEDDCLMTKLRRFGTASKPGRPATNNRDSLSRSPGGALKHGDIVLVDMIGGVPLQATDFAGITFAIQDDTSAFTQDRRRTHAGAARAEDVCAQDRTRRGGQISIGDFLDERGDVDARRTGLDAGRIEAKEAAIGLKDSFLRGVARRDVGHAGGRGLRSKLRTDWHKQIPNPALR